ncbi:MAG: hypothetical protein JO061_08055 [Acidobacteriaceae bacterium]|nr:hypothetical protein [Acidobacteriaceae bacterium]
MSQRDDVEQENIGRGMWRSLGYLLLVILAIKFVFYLLDAKPKFLLGDSESYLWTALTGWIPTDRSFTFGFILRALAVWPHSFAPMVLVQAALSGISCWMGAVCLLRYFKAQFRVAALAALLCAVEPLQLISERFALTEAVATFLFAIYILLAFEYLKTARLSLLIVAQVISVALISLRISFLPMMVLNAALLPLLASRAMCVWTDLWRRLRVSRKTSVKPRAIGWRPVVIHLLAGVLVSQLLFYGYRHINGRLTRNPPAYLYTDGLFLLSYWAPIVQPSDFPVAAWRDAIFNHLAWRLDDPRARNAQAFAPGGLILNVVNATKAGGSAPDMLLANKLAKKTALRAAKRDPIGLLRLSGLTVAQYFDHQYLKETTEQDEGHRHGIPATFSRELQTDFHQPFQEKDLDTLTERWHVAALPWYQFLVVSPLLFSVLAMFAEQKYLSYWIVLGVAAWIFFAQLAVVAHHPTVRYLTALAWLMFIMLPAVIESVVRRIYARQPVGASETIPSSAARVG